MSTQGEKNKLIQDFGLTTTRRKFIKGAVISTPIIASVSSRPVWATAVSAVSGNLSGNLSQPTDELPPANGQSPGYWQGGSDKGARIDALGVVTRSTSFASIFFQTGLDSPSGFPWTSSYTGDLITAVKDGGSSNQPERYAAAHYLNAISNNAGFGGYPYSGAQIIDFYGYYHRGDITYSQIVSIFEKITHCGTIPEAPSGVACI